MSLIDTLAGVATAPAPPPVVVASVSPEPKESTGVALRIVLYNALADPEADKFLPWMWKRMQDDDLVDYYFPGQKATGFASFVKLFSGDSNVAIFLNDSASGADWESRIIGFITWTPSPLSPDAIIAGFIFFRKYWDHHTTDEAARAAFKFWFADGTVQVVLGVCPSEHVVALRYNKRVGLHEMGRIPMQHVFKGKPCDAVLMGITRAEWGAR